MKLMVIMGDMEGVLLVILAVAAVLATLCGVWLLLLAAWRAAWPLVRRRWRLRAWAARMEADRRMELARGMSAEKPRCYPVRGDEGGGR